MIGQKIINLSTWVSQLYIYQMSLLSAVPVL